MRRLLMLSVAAVMAVSFVPSASADYECHTKEYGVVAGDLKAGVCAGTWCPDLCLIELQPYCEGSKLCPALGSLSS